MTANPFDPKTAFLAEHAQHVVLIHYPIALFTVAVVFDYIAEWSKCRALEVAAYFNFLVATVFTLPALVTGLLAWQWALEGQKVKGILLLHLLIGLASTVLIWLVLWIHRHGRQIAAGSLPNYRLPLEAITVFFLGMTGHLGGVLSGVNNPT